MENQTKAKINLNEGTIELEGNEEFVTKYLEEFKDKFLSGITISSSPQQKTSQKSKYKPVVKSSVSKETKKRKNVKNIEVEEFNIDGNKAQKIPSLKEFFESKKPGKSAPNRIVTIGYYITRHAGLDEFSEGNIEYAYKALNLSGRPAHLHQIIINKKNEKKWFDEGSDKQKWKLNRLGEIYVDEQLPEKKEKE